jgi:DNA polymerase I-like protein with 3'-5' exonuclease and polymerase domains
MGQTKARKMLRQRKKDIHEFIKSKTGVAIEPWAAASVQQVFEALNLQYPKTEAGAPSFTKQYLNAHPHEVCQAIVQLRETDKADSTFIDTILRHEHNGRIHTEFHQLRSDDGGTVTGRFSSSNPNLQQIPARDPEIKKLIRGLFIPEQGSRWGSFDYSSQEPRLLVHFAASIRGENRHDMIDSVVKAYNEGDVDLHQMVADFAGITRKEAKVVNLGIMYGMGKGKLAGQLGISEEEAGALLQTHHEKVPFVKGLADLAMQQAAKHGVIRTLLGRRCNFHLWEPRSFGYKKPLPFEEAMKEYGQPLTRAFTYKALNKLIQGSAADQTKKAMADCYAEGLLPMLTVHDELCFSVESSVAICSDQRDHGDRSIRVLKVPSKVDAELGDNWGEVG